jgi:chromosome segregation ATPase
MSPGPGERDRIRAAMDRILAGTARHSTGALTIVALAQEAGVPRNALTQRHPDLRNEFYERVKERGATPEVEARLRATIVTLKNTIASKNKELDQLRADVPALVRAINQLTLENRQLREQLADAGPDIIPLRSRNSPNPTAGRITGLREDGTTSPPAAPGPAGRAP